MHFLFHVLFLLFAASILLYFIYVAVHLISWTLLPERIVSGPFSPKTKISIIIAARNEEATITNCLAAVSAQTYPANLMEIIVVDDHSTDKTKEVAEKFLSKIAIPGKCISDHEKAHGKKSALTEGIKNSSGELIVITDADCISSPKWLSTIENEYQKSGAYMLCGPVQIVGENTFIKYFQSLELCGLSLLSGAGIKAGLPLLCNGANIAYTRNVFNDVEGFKGIDNNPSGDDILLMFKIHKKYPRKIQYVKSKDAIVSTAAQATLKDFILQRVRWASKGLYSKNPANSFISTLVFGSNFLSVIAIIFILVRAKLFPILMCCLALKIIADFLLLLFGAFFFGKKKLLWIFPVAELVTMFYISWVGIAANFSSYSWKDRHYKHPV
jgi:cellulose synthase/poly-beta-1,6-N-acetylglucosamine synthase-like glycosyltransferase